MSGFGLGGMISGACYVHDLFLHGLGSYTTAKFERPPRGLDVDFSVRLFPEET